MPVNKSSRKTVEQIEQLFFLCNKLPLGKSEKFKKKQFLALILFEAYRGSDTLGKTNSDQLYADEELSIFFLAYALGIEILPDFIDSNVSNLQWLTSWRLGTLRTNRALTVNPIISEFHTHSLTGDPYDFFNTLQLSYGLELVLYGAKLHQKAFKPETNEDVEEYYKPLSWYFDWPVLRQVIKQGTYWYNRFEYGRLRQIFSNLTFIGLWTNAAAWFSVNEHCYRYYPTPCTMLAILNLIAFVFDILHDSYIKSLEIKKTKELLESIKAEDSQLLKDLNLLDHQDTLVEELEKNLANLNFQWWRVTLSDTGILVGMILIYAVVLPIVPGFFHFLGLMALTDPQRLKEIGTYITILAGVICGGFGYRLYKNIDASIFEQMLTPEFTLNALLIVGSSALIYVLSPLVPLFALMAGAYAASLIPYAIKKYYSQKKAEDKAFKNFLADESDMQHISHTYSKIMKPELRPNIPVAEQSVLDINDFCKLTTDERNLIRKKSGFSDNYQWLSFLKNWSKKDNKKREVFSTVTITQLLEPSSPILSPASSPPLGSLQNSLVVVPLRHNVTAPALLTATDVGTDAPPSPLRRTETAPSRTSLEPHTPSSSPEVSPRRRLQMWNKGLALEIPSSSSSSPSAALAPTPPPTSRGNPSILQRTYFSKT